MLFWPIRICMVQSVGVELSAVANGAAVAACRLKRFVITVELT